MYYHADEVLIMYSNKSTTYLTLMMMTLALTCLTFEPALIIGSFVASRLKTQTIRTKKNKIAQLRSSRCSIDDGRIVAMHQFFWPLNRISETWNKLDSVLDNVDKTSARTGDIADQIFSVLNPADNFMDTKAVKGLMSLTRIIVNCCMAKDKLKVWNFLFNVSSEFGPAAVKALTPLFIKGRDRILAREEFSLSDINMDSLQNVFGEHKNLTRITLAASLAILLQISLGLPTTTDFDSMLKFFGDRSRNMNNILSFGKNSSDVFQTASDYVLDSIMPGYATTEMDEYVSGYDKWAKAVLSLGNVENPVENRIQKDKKLVFLIDKLYKQGVEYAGIIRILRVKPSLIEHYQKVFKIIEEYRKKCDYTGVFGNRPRCKPLVVYLFGASGVGKSGMSWPLSVDLNAYYSADLEQARNFASEIYFRNVEQEFWDGYHGQNVVIYDDFGQRSDSGSSPNEEFMEVIRTANIAPYPLHMAQIEEKKRTKFISQAIILTSNILEQKVNSLTFPDAVFRRIDICGEVKVRDEFAKSCYSSSLGQVVQRLDRSKCNSPVDTRPYAITVYDAESKMPLKDKNGADLTVSYEKFLRMCLDVSEQSYADSMEFNTLLSERIDSERFARIKGQQPPVARIIEDNVDTCEQDVPVLEGLALLAQQDERLTSLRAKHEFTPKCEDIMACAHSTLEECLSDPKSCYEHRCHVPDRVPESTSPSTKWISVKGYASTMWNSVSGITNPLPTIKDKVMNLPSWFSEQKEMVFSMDPDTGIFYDHRFKITTAEIREAMREKYEQFNKLKTLFFVIGLILVGFGAWKLFSKDKPKERYLDSCGTSDTPASIAKKVTIAKEVCLSEAASSGDFKTNRLERIKTEARVSGDESTRQNARTVTEGFGSGDSNTQQVKRFTCEAFASGDSRTNQSRRNVVEAFGSGDHQTRTTRTVKTESAIPSEMQVWADKGAGDLISHRILSNLYKLYSNDMYLVNGLFIRDNIMLTPRHALPFIKERLTITNGFGTEFSVPVKDLRVVMIDDRAGNQKDAVLIQFPRYVNAHSDIVKHFQTMPELQYRSANVCLPSLRRVAEKLMFVILGNQKADFTSVELEIEGKPVNIRDAISYRLNTVNGDCGAPVIVNETCVLRKIAGIHIAAAIDGSAAFGQSITQKDLIDHLAKFQSTPIVTDLDDLPNFKVVPSTVQCDVNYSAEDLVSLTKLPAKTFGYVGACSKVAFAPSETDIQPSVINGYTTTLTKPAYLRRSGMNLLHKNVEKCALNTPYIPDAEVKRAVKEVEAKLLTGESRKYLNKILSFEDAIKGNDSSEFVGSINRRTSPGYPWVLEKKHGSVGKTQWLGDDEEFLFDEEVRAVVNNRIELAKKGIRTPTVWTDTLKDERRPIEKVEALKTRVFSHGPFDYTIAFRMYFLGFIAHIMENRVTNEQSIGTNVYNKDWLLTYKKLQQKGRRVFAGDFSTFDGTLNTCIMAEFADVANRFYNDGPENAMVRKVLMLDVFNSIHLCEDLYYACNHSQPSGNPLTTVLNSFYNSVSMRIAFYRVVGTAFKFEDEVSMVSYGDDNVVNISDRVSAYFNQNSCTEAYATFGMIYTDEAKSGDVTPDYRMISEVAYLKRGFRLDEYNYVRAPMSLNTLTETPQWVRKSPDSQLACKVNLEDSVRELAQHPKAVFTELSEKMINAFYDATSVYPDTKTYETYIELFNEEYFGNRAC